MRSENLSGDLSLAQYAERYSSSARTLLLHQELPRQGSREQARRQLTLHVEFLRLQGERIPSAPNHPRTSFRSLQGSVFEIGAVDKRFLAMRRCANSASMRGGCEGYDLERRRSGRRGRFLEDFRNLRLAVTPAVRAYP